MFCEAFHPNHLFLTVGISILSAGGYTKRLIGPGIIFKYEKKYKKFLVSVSTTSKLWTVHFTIKKSKWFHLMFIWCKKKSLAVYENGQLLGEDNHGQNVRYPEFESINFTLMLGNPGIFTRPRFGAIFQIGHLVLQVPPPTKHVKQNKKSPKFCEKKISKFKIPLKP